MTDRKKIIYLCGNISSDPETYKWREKATELLKDKYRVFNPAANTFNKRLIKVHKGEADGFLKDAIARSQRLLIIKDFNLVQTADILLVNVALITPEKPPLGTIFELAWAWLLKKPVIAIIGDNLYSVHPFPATVFSATTETVEEACELIHEFFEE